MFAKMNTLLCLMGLLTLTGALPSVPKETPPPSLEQRQHGVRAYHALNPRSASRSASGQASQQTPPQADVTEGPDQLTITVVNKMAEPVSTSCASNAGVPGLVSGGTATGTLTPGETATVVAPREWAGMVAVNLAKYPLNGRASLLEGSLKAWGDVGYRVDMDVSYV